MIMIDWLSILWQFAPRYKQRFYIDSPFIDSSVPVSILLEIKLNIKENAFLKFESATLLGEITKQYLNQIM